jgi:hypothetical protein
VDTLTLNWKLPFGAPADVPDSPLVMSRALRGVLGEGKPQGSIRVLYFQPSLSDARVHWFGVVLLSQGGRVLFFTPSVISGFELYNNSRTKEKRSFAVDHLTLEADFASWHITGTDHKKKAGGPRTVRLASGGYLWFGMSSAGPEHLPPVVEGNQLTFMLPETDSRRRRDLLNSVLSGATDQIISLNPQAFHLAAPWYVQFNVAVGPLGFDPRADEIGRFMVNPSADVLATGPHVQTAARTHRVTLSPTVELLICAFPLPGNPKDRWALMGYA